MKPETTYKRNMSFTVPECTNCDNSKMEPTTQDEAGRPYPYKMFWCCTNCGQIIEESGGLEGAISWLVACAVATETE